MNDLSVPMRTEVMSAQDIRSHVNRVQEVMQAVMKEDVHYGVVPGTERKTLYKQGAEVLCMTFHIAPKYEITDLSDDDKYRYRVVCRGLHAPSGTFLGEGWGACSSSEEKYKWREVPDAEYDTLPEDRRRIKYVQYRKKGGEKVQYQKFQGRAEPEDIDNTVLKMACKRAYIAMVLAVTAASDIFGQDIEDLPEHLRRPVDEHGEVDDKTGDDEKKPRQRPQARADATPNKATQDKKQGETKSAAPATDGQKTFVQKRLDAAKLKLEDFLAYVGIEKLDDLTNEQGNKVGQFIADSTKKAA